MPTLAETQLLLRDAIVRDDAGGLATLLGGPDSEKGLGIHRRNYETSLVTALLTKFPATVWLAGSTFLSQAAKRFAHEHPPLAPCIAEYGQDFPGFMASLAGAESVPYLADFSNLEWHVGRVSIEIDEPSLALEQFCAINPDILPEMACVFSLGCAIRKRCGQSTSYSRCSSPGLLRNATRLERAPCGLKSRAHEANSRLIASMHRNSSFVNPFPSGGRSGPQRNAR